MATEKKTEAGTAKRARAGDSTAGKTPRTGKKSHKFSIDAPVAHDVAIAGSFNEWAPRAMKRGAKGIWSISLPLAPGTYEYKFVVDSEWLEDPSCHERVSSPLGGFNSVCIIP